MNYLTKINQVELRYTRPHISELPEISFPFRAIQYLRDFIEEGVLDMKERCWVLLLTAESKLLGLSEISSVTILGDDTFTREIIQLALLANATGIILVHNHPSGNLEPSLKDIKVTRNISEICKVMNIQLSDHIIITKSRPFYNL
jgi:DNA repair protein RadC